MKVLKLLIPVFFPLLLSWDTYGQSLYYDKIQTYLSEVKKEKRYQSQIEFIITDEVIDKRSGLRHLYIQHTFNDIPIIGSISGFHFDNNAKLKHVSLRLPHEGFTFRKSKRNVHSEYDALKRIATILGLKLSFKFEKKSSSKLIPHTYNVPSLSSENIFLREALLEYKNSYISVWEVGIYIDFEQSWQVLRLDMNTGEEIDRDSWTHECFSHTSEVSQPQRSRKSHDSFPSTTTLCDSTYNIFAYPLIAPSEGLQSEVTTPWHLAPIASPSGWHDTTFLRGNNILAVEDIDDNNTGGYSVDGGSNLCFGTNYNGSLGVVDNLDVSLANAFYWNNLIHDVMYGYGFDEAAGNFQQSNFDRGGKEFDRVTIDILDGSGKNNANFSTPPDGFSARMQMFEWVPSVGNVLEINKPESAAIAYNMLPALFGPNDLTIKDTIVLADPLLACDDILNSTALMGQIAMIDRGDCNFSAKALNAQSAGAIAIMVCNNDTTDIFRMGGADEDTITIPSIMLGKSDCDSLKIVLSSSVLEATITIPGTFDSGLDNGILIHEYAHGISTRLTGGPSSASCLIGNEQMGEGWSDWYALMFSLDDSDLPESPIGIGSYVLGQAPSGAGIRDFPYSTDLLINPLTYNDIKSLSVPHGVGSVWASMLWDMTWNLIDSHGFDPDIYNGKGGNNIALSLVTLGLKLQPCDPGFVDGRDAILIADELLYDGANACAIWKAFARRGLGINAKQGSSVSSQDGTEDFSLPEICASPILFSATSSGIAYSRDTLPVYFDIRTNSLVVDTANISGFLPNEINFYSGDYSSLYNDTLTIVETLIDSNTLTRNPIDVTFSPLDSSAIYHLEKIKRMETNWSIESETGNQLWQVSDVFPLSDSLSFFCKNVDGNQTQFLISPEFKIEGPTLLGFWHYYNLEKNWDGAFVEISKDAGSSWIDLGIDALSNGYNDKLKQSSNSFSEGRAAYTGSNQEYQQTFIDLTRYSGESIQIRFVLASDRFVFEEGWYIDNISLYHKYEVKIPSQVTYDNNQILYDTASIVILPRCEPCDKDLCDMINISISTIEQDETKAFQFIESDATLSIMDDVRFIAGDSIMLLQNFTVPNEAIFQAIIDQCIEP